ncbi:MAG: twin-arginine translocase TatA/TatE family subunit [Tissierellia bacterium]|nr:twin-arginine translocase TatA/TatE family subunit [Tissierellia bacterium]
MHIGTGELLVILLIALVIFGPSRLPELGRVLGKTINEFRTHANKTANELREVVKEDSKEEENFKTNK